MKRCIILSLMLILLAGLFAENKALVIGNSEYGEVVLASPVNNANAMRDALADKGYSVTYGANLSLSQMTAVIDTFTASLSSEDVAIFYYSGHGAHGSGSNNYLMPVDADPAVTDFYSYPSVSIHLNQVLEKLSKAGQSAVILDASRTWPLKDGGSLSLSFVWEGPCGEHQMITTSTGPDRVIREDSASFSPFTNAIVTQLSSGASSLNTIVRDVCENLPKLTEDKYMPWWCPPKFGDITFEMSIMQKMEEPILKEELEGGGSISW